MKKIFKSLIFGVIALASVSCEHFLDVNENQNEATESTPQQVLPNALTNTAALVVTYNDYGSWHVGYIVNAGGFGGWGSTLNYNYTTNDYAALWSQTFDNINDYNYIEKSSNNVDGLQYYNAMAKIMLAYDYQMLVDTYGDVPYTEALQGSDILTPKYDDAQEIYRDLVENKLDSAIYIINNSPNANAVASGDVLFNGNMERWERFANTLKLRMLLRVQDVPELAAFVSEELAEFGSDVTFLEDDAIVNPGYLQSAGKQNPMWNRYHSDAAGTAQGQGRSRLPSDFILDFYNGGKLADDGRGSVIYRSFPATPSNVLGYEDADAPTAPSGNIAWYTGSGGQNTVGIFKGATMGQPIMLAAESFFLQAEAMEHGLLTGDASAAYRQGVISSFRYLYKGVDGNLGTYKGMVENVETGEEEERTFTYDPVADADAYIADNAGNSLVDYMSSGNKIETILTQKYIALNFIHGHEAWNEFRRTGYPTITNASTFASIRSASPRADNLPARILYPASEYQVNPNNAPSGISPFTTTIFWDQN